jgi:hypothetical protein
VGHRVRRALVPETNHAPADDARSSIRRALDELRSIGAKRASSSFGSIRVRYRTRARASSSILDALVSVGHDVERGTLVALRGGPGNQGVWT